MEAEIPVSLRVRMAWHSDDWKDVNTMSKVPKVVERQEDRKGGEIVSSIAVDRPEDMSPTGVLTLYCQPDGDVIVVVRQTIDPVTCLVMREPIEAQVEFCTRPGGGRSPRTLAALKELAAAMAKDNADPNSRAKCVNWSGEELLNEVKS